jgi:hypothetical protein
MTMDNTQPASAFQSEQHVRADGFASWFGVGEIIAVNPDERRALVKYNGLYTHQMWFDYERLTDAEQERAS